MQKVICPECLGKGHISVYVPSFEGDGTKKGETKLIVCPYCEGIGYFPNLKRVKR